METELKLLLRPESAEALRRHPLLSRYAVAPPREQALSAIYFDTENHDLRHADAGLRVRQVNQDWIQTLKAGGTVIAGLHERHEWESNVSGPTPDLEALRRQIDPKSSFARLLKNLGKGGRLAPAFTTTIKRTVWDLRLPGGDEVECVIDLGSIHAQDSATPVSEMELELKSGDPRQLFELALQLQDDVPMQIGNLSKADRGYGLITPEGFSAVKASPVRLLPKMSIEHAFKTIVLNCLAQIQANEPGLSLHAGADAADSNSEAVHQMRVGLRRLRSALSMFGERIECPAEIASELRWLGSTLGVARDWDVLQASTFPGMQRAMASPDVLQPLRDAVQSRIRLNHEAVAAAVGSPRYTRLMLTFFSWVQGAQWRNRLSGAEHCELAKPIAGFARDVLRDDQRRLIKRGRGLANADAQARHRLRIAAKRARYATEFFSSLYAAKSVRRYVKSLAMLQESLGLLNDAAVARNLLREIEAAQPHLRVESTFILGYLACRLDQENPALLQQWKAFRKISPPLRRRSA